MSGWRLPRGKWWDLAFVALMAGGVWLLLSPEGQALLATPLF